MTIFHTNEYGDLVTRDDTRVILLLPRLWDFCEYRSDGASALVSSVTVGDVSVVVDRGQLKDCVTSDVRMMCRDDEF